MDSAYGVKIGLYPRLSGKRENLLFHAVSGMSLHLRSTRD